MKEVSMGQGRTVLFVSHNMGSINSLCTNAVLMKNGQISQVGKPKLVVDQYLNTSNQLNLNLTNRKGSQLIKLLNLKIINSENNVSNSIYCGEKMDIILSLECEKIFIGKKILVIINITNENQNLIYQFRSDEINPNLIISKSKKINLEIPKNNLRPSNYFISVRIALNSFSNEDICDHVDNCKEFTVLSNDFYDSGKTIKKGSFGILDAKYLSKN